MENTKSKNTFKSVEKMDNLDYSKGEPLIKNITIPNSAFTAKWEKEKGYAVGIEGIKLTKDYQDLDNALINIGYGVDVDENGDEVLVKVGDIDYEMIVRVIKALLIIEELKTQDNG